MFCDGQYILLVICWCFVLIHCQFFWVIMPQKTNSVQESVTFGRFALKPNFFLWSRQTFRSIYTACAKWCKNQTNFPLKTIYLVNYTNTTSYERTMKSKSIRFWNFPVADARPIGSRFYLQRTIGIMIYDSFRISPLKVTSKYLDVISLLEKNKITSTESIRLLVFRKNQHVFCSDLFSTY